MSVVLREPTFVPDETAEYEGFLGFPGKLFLVRIDEGRYACNSATLTDGVEVKGLACFRSEEDAEVYKCDSGGLDGETVGTTFEEAREIAKSKPILAALLLFAAGRIVEVHHVR